MSWDRIDNGKCNCGGKYISRVGVKKVSRNVLVLVRNSELTKRFLKFMTEEREIEPMWLDMSSFSTKLRERGQRQVQYVLTRHYRNFLFNPPIFLYFSFCTETGYDGTDEGFSCLSYSRYC